MGHRDLAHGGAGRAAGRWKLHPEVRSTDRFALDRAADGYALTSRAAPARWSRSRRKAVRAAPSGLPRWSRPLPGTPARAADGRLHPGHRPGTFGSDRLSGEDIAEAVIGAAEVGYRHFDCAPVYGNEHLIGQSSQAIMARRRQARGPVGHLQALERQARRGGRRSPPARSRLRDLRLDYLDLYLVHWPFPNFHPPGCDVTLAQRGREAVHPRELHEDVAPDGEARGPGPRAAHRHVQHDDPQARSSLLRDARDQARPRTRWSCTRTSSSRSCSSSCVDNGIVPIGYSPHRLARAGPSATGRRKTRWTSRTP